MPAATGAVLEQHRGTGPSSDQAASAGEPRLSVLLGSLADDPRIRSNARNSKGASETSRDRSGRAPPRFHRGTVPDCEVMKCRTEPFLCLSCNVATLPKIAVSAEEFLRRFMLHVLPRGFVQIRFAGFLANRRRRQRLPLCQQLLEARPQQPTETPGSSDALQALNGSFCSMFPQALRRNRLERGAAMNRRPASIGFRFTISFPGAFSKDSAALLAHGIQCVSPGNTPSQSFSPRRPAAALLLSPHRAPYSRSATHSVTR
jgi:hypothetical protein